MQKLRDTGHPPPNHGGLLWLRRPSCHEYNRYRRQGGSWQSPFVPYLILPQIILRARHQHLVDGLKKEHPQLDQELIDLAHLSWEKYLTSKVLKTIPAAELEAQSDHLMGKWAYIQARILDEQWLAAAQARDEKFAMHISTLVRFIYPCEGSALTGIGIGESI